MFDDVANLSSIEGFVFEEGLGDKVELGPVFGQKFDGSSISVVNEQLDFGVDSLSRRLTVVAHPGNIPGEEDWFVAFSVLNHSQFFTHTPVADHLAGDAGGLLNVAMGPAGDVTKDDVLSHSTAHDDHEVVEQFFAPGVVFVFFG